MTKKKVLFVTATNTNVGKTYACEKLLYTYAKKGYKVGYFKPIETGVVNNLPADGAKLLAITKQLNPLFENVNINEVVPYQFSLPAAPFVAKNKSKIDLHYLQSQKEKLCKLCDVLIIEGAGGLMVPIKKNFFMLDLISYLGAKAVLIVPSSLGSINDTLLSMQALRNQKIKFAWYINLYQDKESFATITLPFYQAYFKKIRFLENEAQ